MVHLVGFHYKNMLYHDARSSECQIRIILLRTAGNYLPLDIA